MLVDEEAVVKASSLTNFIKFVRNVSLLSMKLVNFKVLSGQTATLEDHKNIYRSTDHITDNQPSNVNVSTHKNKIILCINSFLKGKKNNKQKKK